MHASKSRVDCQTNKTGLSGGGGHCTSTPMDAIHGENIWNGSKIYINKTSRLGVNLEFQKEKNFACPTVKRHPPIKLYLVSPSLSPSLPPSLPSFFPPSRLSGCRRDYIITDEWFHSSSVVITPSAPDFCGFRVGVGIMLLSPAFFVPPFKSRVCTAIASTEESCAILGRLY